MINRRRLLGIPLARRSTRRWLVVGYWAVALPLVWTESQPRAGAAFPSDISFWVLIAIVSLAGILGRTLRAFDGPTPDQPTKTDYAFMTVEDIAAKKNEERRIRLDERDTLLRNAIHYRAYAIIRGSAFPIAIAAWRFNQPQFAHFRSMLLWLAFIVLMSLPQSMILWTEPDMEEVR